MESLTGKKCIPCEGHISPLSESEENEYMEQILGWVINRKGTHYLSKQFTFEDFNVSMWFVNAVANLAEEEGHHPDIHIYYDRVTVELHTHAISGLHENDFIMAAKIDEIKLKNKKGRK